jgi:hypothetical protein
MTPPPGVALRRREFVVPTVAEVLPRRDDYGAQERASQPSPGAQQRTTLLNRPLPTGRFSR